MFFGAMNFPLKDLEEEIRAVASLGFDFLELAMDAPEGLPSSIWERSNRLQRVLKECSLGLVAHLPTFVWPADLTPRIRKASLEECLEGLELASYLEAHCVVLHPGSFFGLGNLARDLSTQAALESLEALLEKASSLGLQVGVENMFPRGGWLVTPKDFAPVMNRFPNLGITLDVAHAFIGGGLQRIQEFLSSYPERILHVHLSDNWGERDDHLPIGAGRIPFSKVVAALKDCQYAGWATLEVFSPDRDYLKISRRKLQRMWRDVSMKRKISKHTGGSGAKAPNLTGHVE